MSAICVFCASSERIERRYIDLAEDLGLALARRGHELVTGGGSVSCMGALARAVRSSGGRTVGVIPQALMSLEVADHDSDELVVTDTMRQRKDEMDRRADAFIALPGGLGTLEELLEIWVARTLRMHNKPIVILDPWDSYAELRAQVERLIDGGFARPAVRDAVHWVQEPREALDYIEEQLLSIRPTLPPTPSEVLEAEP